MFLVGLENDMYFFKYIEQVNKIGFKGNII